MSIQKMSLVKIYGDIEKVDDVLFKCAMTSNFHPNEPSAQSNMLSGLSLNSEESPYDALINELLEICSIAELDIIYEAERVKSIKKKAINIFTQNIDKALLEAKNMNSPISKHIHNLENALRYAKEQSESDAEITVGDIFACEDLKVRFGYIPLTNVDNVKNYSSDKFIFIPCEIEHKRCFGMYFAPNQYLKEVSKFLEGHGFVHIWIPAISVDNTQNELKVADDYLTNVKDIILSQIKKREHIISKIDQLESAYKQLGHIKNLPISIDEILSCKYLKMHFGKLPHDSYVKLPYFDDKTFAFHELSRDGMYHWGVYITTLEDETEVEDIFDSLYFEKIDIPNFVHGVPENAEEEILERINYKKELLTEINQQIEKSVKKYKEDFINLYIRFNFLKQAFSLRKYVSAAKNKFVITGYIPNTDNEKFTKVFEHITNINIDISPAKSDNIGTVPTKLKNGWFSKPFEMFIDMYGLPCYEDFDPTRLFAITYTILFGIMFGDLGQGLSFALIGYVISKKTNNPLGGVITRVGMSSAFFGFWYGSVFGDEHLLDPIFTNVLGFKAKPIHVMEPSTTSVLLITSIALGAVLIVIALLANIYVGFKRKDFERALFSNNGIAGGVLYIYLLSAIALKFTGKINILSPAYIILFVIVPLIFIFLKHPLGKLIKGEKLHFEGGIGAFVTEGIFELFEVCLSFVTNTMSFLRVGGFVLSHAGMMLVVVTLSEMMSVTGDIIISILGNLFVMGLEGFIVGIQALRLEFYEMFSRYYDGEGIPFSPISIKEENSVLVND